MIVRDDHGIICQHSPTDPLDGGDSAARTGLMALTSQFDADLLPNFILNNQLVRHPHQKKWNDPLETSRDQAVQYFVSVKNSHVAEALAQKWFLNKDFLDPAVKLYFWRGTIFDPPKWLLFLGTLWMWLALIWNTKIKPDEEMNQYACMCIKAGPRWVKRLYDWHPHLDKTIMAYWCGWRDQPEIGEAFTTYLRREALK